jgi:hypothetical protein
MEKYAEGIYTFLLKRKFLRKLILNVELNKVVYKFLEVLSTKFFKNRYLFIMKDVAAVKREKNFRAENLKQKFAQNFYNKKLTFKFFKLLFNNFSVNKKLEEHYIKKLGKIRILNYKRKLFNFLINNYNGYISLYRTNEKKILAFKKVTLKVTL